LKAGFRIGCPLFCFQERRKVLRFYSQAGTGIGKLLFMLGLAIAGLGVLVFIFRDILAAVAAVLLILAGIGLSLVAARMMWNARLMRRSAENQEQGYRENVMIRGGQNGNSL
jgi:hypothetical protein